MATAHTRENSFDLIYLRLLAQKRKDMVAAEKVTLPLKKMPFRPKAHANKFIWPEIS